MQNTSYTNRSATLLCCTNLMETKDFFNVEISNHDHISDKCSHLMWGSAQEILYHTSSFAQQEGRRKKRMRSDEGRYMKVLKVCCQIK